VDIDGAVDFASTTAHAGDATFADNVTASFGAGSDLQILHNGSDSYITEVGTGNLIIRSTTSTIFQGAVTLTVTADLITASAGTSTSQVSTQVTALKAVVIIILS
jgi:hypothetical protein